jgi:hypothetical protein
MDSNISNKRRSEPAQAGSLDVVVSTPICDKAKIEVLHCSDHGSGYLKAVDIETAESLEREKTFYRDLLQQITQDPRKTRARRLVESGLTFWDAMREEKAKRANPRI